MRRLLMLAALVAVGLVSVGVGMAAASTSLPDNRGWEIVTPPDQDMDALSRFWSTPDGNVTAFQSLGAFSGAENGSTNGYLTRRGADGWTTQALTPPGGAGRLFYLTAVSADTQRTVWVGNTLIGGSGNDIWVRDRLEPAVNASAPVITPDDETAIYQGSSSDASHVLFVVDPGGDAAGYPDPLRLYDYSDGVASPVGILPGETTPSSGGSVLGSYDYKYGQGSVMNAISEDGSKIFFESPAPPRDPFDHFPYWPSGLYVRENGTTTTEIDPNATYWGAAVDGSTVVYTPVDGGGDRGLSTYDVAAKKATVIVPPSAQVQGLGGISDDASRIYFVALADLAAGATAGESNLYLAEAGSLHFIATVNPGTTSPGGTTGYTYFNPGEAADYGGNGVYSPSGPVSATSADGRILVFLSKKQLTSYDNQGHLEAYVYDASKPAQPLACISCRTDGAPPTGDAGLQDAAFSNAPAPPAPATNVTDDGQRIFFQTPDPLDPQDVNGQMDVYEWTDGAAHLISSGTGDFSQFNTATPSGDDVFFNTSNVLVPQNTVHGLVVVYDARVGGGFPLPAVVTPCEQGGTCQGVPSAAPAVAAAGSVTFSGSGNVVERSTAAKSAPVFRVGAIGRKARARLARTGRVTIKVRVGAAGKVSVRMRARVGKRVRTVAHATRTARHAGTVRLRLRLSKAARHRLRSGHRLRVRTVVRYSRAHASRHASFVLVGAKHKRGH